MASYKKGVRFEHRCAKHFEDLGFHVFRMAGSHSMLDLICLNKDETILIQCRLRGNLSKEEERELVGLGRELGHRVLLAYKVDGGLMFRNIYAPIQEG